MRFSNPKYNNSSVNEGEKITIGLSPGSNISQILNAISTEDNVISVVKRKFGENWHCVHTTLPFTEIDAFAAYLKQKYFLDHSYHDKPVEATTYLNGENKPWIWGQGIEPSQKIIDEAQKKTAQPGIKSLPCEELDPFYGPK